MKFLPVLLAALFFTPFISQAIPGNPKGYEAPEAVYDTVTEPVTQAEPSGPGGEPITDTARWNSRWAVPVGVMVDREETILFTANDKPTGPGGDRIGIRPGS